jgi:hypothetical protein
MRCSPTFNRWALSAALAAALSLVAATGALAARPKAGKLYTGPTSASYNGFTAPVSFTVSKNGRQLLSFKWAGGGCIGLGGPGNAWTNPANTYKVGTLNVSRTGTFAVKNVTSTFRGKQGARAFTKVTTSTVTGRFKIATAATGTISFTQKITKTCAGKVRFTATLGQAPGALRKLSPASGASLTSNTPTLSWSASTTATAYRYCIATSENGRCIGGWVSTNTSTHATLRALAPGSYYWQVIASSVHGTVAADNGGWSSFSIPAPQPKPKPGYWVATSLAGSVGPVSSIYFSVLPDQATETGFGFVYHYSHSSAFDHCDVSASGVSAWIKSPTSPIVGGQFREPPGIEVWSESDGNGASGSGTFAGTFDSPTSAHGTASFSATIYCGLTPISSGPAPFSWTATWRSAS